MAEKEELQAANNALQGELKETPGSMTARIHSLTELNATLNTYFKEYCNGENLNAQNHGLSASVDSLNSQLVDHDQDHKEEMRVMTE